MTAAEKPRKPRSSAHDWEAIERDYSTGKFTDGELSDIHNVARETITRRRSADVAKNPNSWRRSLSQEVRQTARMLLIQDTAERTPESAARDKAALQVAILTSAEIAKGVILSHRENLVRAKSVAMDLLQELQGLASLKDHVEVLAAVLAGEGAEASDLVTAQEAIKRALSVGNRVNSIKGLAEALTKLHTAERVAFDLDEKATDPTDALAQLVATMRGSSIKPVATLPASEA